ncbi:hypothetical protein KALB_7936 [Kutzneria albida DSM 43870]|uniref:Uncharacterized protein n=2 Tax=Kutzneria TaxID=43356 RepID=W5WJB4_9PSEU|nr:hypothetical protein KALB_7936 [Kutzneria albida DSM 43870]
MPEGLLGEERIRWLSETAAKLREELAQAELDSWEPADQAG